MKSKKIILIILSLIAMIGLSGMLLGDTNRYEKALLGVWITDKLDYAFLLKEDNECDVIDYETYQYDDDIEAKAKWSATYNELSLIVYLSSGNSSNKFKYEYVETFNLSKKKYKEKEIQKIVKESGADGYISSGFIILKDYYVLYTEVKKAEEVEKKLKEMKVKVDEKSKISKENFIKAKVVESSEKDFDPKKDNTAFMIRIAKTGKELQEMNSY